MTDRRQRLDMRPGFVGWGYQQENKIDRFVIDGAEFDFFLTDLTNPFVRGTHPLYGPGTLLRHTGSGVYIWHVDEAVVRDHPVGL